MMTSRRFDSNLHIATRCANHPTLCHTGNLALPVEPIGEEGGEAAVLLLAAAEAEEEERDAADDAMFELPPLSPPLQPQTVFKVPPAVAPKPTAKQPGEKCDA